MLLVLLLAGCGERIHKQQSYVFGTLVEITIYGEEQDKARRATDQVLRDFDEMHQTLHAWQPGQLETINDRIAKALPGKPARATLKPELAAMLSDAARLSEQAESLFNPAIGNLVRLWGFHSDSFEPHLPDPSAVARLVQANPRMSDLKITGVMLEAGNPAVRLDLGGYAKGYALDLAAATLKSQGVNNALINIGGNIMALGQKGGQAWKVGIQHPRRAGALAMLELRDGEAIGTSGDYQRFFEVNGKRYCHLIDPRSGWPADQTQVVTVIAHGPHAGTLSDVSSKPLFIAGPSDWQRLAKKMGISEALFIAADGSISATRAMNSRLLWEKPAPAVKVVEAP
ncbi:MAG: FAD:protein FMN transferase [Pseudomonadota bacterium]|nr:FAD:protein FMN transferase [Pseudomonadota bacterium]